MKDYFNPTIQQWNMFVRQHPNAHVLQLAAWGELKRAFGWQVLRIALADGSGEVVAGAQILLRPLPFKLGKMAYIPMGPLLTDSIQQMRLWHVIEEQTRRHGARFIKWEPGIYLDDEKGPDFERLGFSKSPQTIQPPRTILIDLQDNDDAIMARMNQGTRRKIRQGEKKQVRFYHGNREDITTFSQLMQMTGARNEFGVHTQAYYELAYDLFTPNDEATLIMAEHEGDILGGVMIFALGRYAWYLYGASSNEKRNLMATYGLQWAGIQWAKAHGCQYYDMWGIPDEDEPILENHFQDRSDGLWGVYGFKRGWGGRIVRSSGTWDKALTPLVYQAYTLGLKLRGG